MKILIGDIDVTEGFIKTDAAQLPIRIVWQGERDKLHTIIIIDNDAPYPAPNNNNSPFLHLLVVNAKNNDLTSGKSLIGYMSPNPSIDSAPHNYSVLIYSQEGEFGGRQSMKRSKRTNFDLENFVTERNLKLIDRANFRVGDISLPVGNGKALVAISNSLQRAQRVETTKRWFKPGTDLAEDKQKWCRCVIE